MKRMATWMLMILGCVIVWVVIIFILLKIIKDYWIYF